MTAVRQLIADEAKVRMDTTDAAEVELMPSADPVSYDAIHIFDGGQTIVEAEAGSTRYQLKLTIEGYFEEQGGPATYAALNARYAQVVSLMMTDPPMSGLAETIDEGDMRIGVAALASKPRLYFSLDFDIGFLTSRTDPAQAA